MENTSWLLCLFLWILWAIIHLEQIKTWLEIVVLHFLFISVDKRVTVLNNFEWFDIHEDMRIMLSNTDNSGKVI